MDIINKINKIDININSFKHSTQLPDPIGYNTTYTDTSNPKKKLKEVAEVKKNKAAELASSQLKQIFMTLISFYFVGSKVSIFTIFFVGMYTYKSLSAVINVNKCKFI